MTNKATDDMAFAANAIANSILKDKAGEIFVNASESERLEIIAAYYANFMKMLENVSVKYMTDTEVKAEFNKLIAAIC